ncbi:hypothetical protein ABW286_21885 [Erwinia papayae]|uniref:Uncharacterized protein n=1 Tax=Erwinia papayae TaxID=206499 RepID=A0ABV3N7J7_9GAMM
MIRFFDLLRNFKSVSASIFFLVVVFLVWIVIHNVADEKNIVVTNPYIQPESQEEVFNRIESMKKDKSIINKFIYSYIKSANHIEFSDSTEVNIISIDTNVEKNESVIEYEVFTKRINGEVFFNAKFHEYLKYNFKKMELPNYDGTMTKSKIDFLEKKLQEGNFGFEITKLKKENVKI